MYRKLFHLTAESAYGFVQVTKTVTTYKIAKHV